MQKSRLEAFSDGMFAIIITVMVLELKVPKGETLDALTPLIPQFLSYVLSFVFVGIYWNNHHHLVHVAKSVDGKMLWANLVLLFWLTLIPFTTAWVGETCAAALPVAIYGANFLVSGVSYLVLQRIILAQLPPDSPIIEAFKDDAKGSISAFGYAAAIPIAFYARVVSCVIYVAIALMWLVPDRRIERAFKE